MVSTYRKIAIIILIIITSTQLAQGQVLLSLLFGDKLNSGKVEFGLNAGFNRSNIRGINGTKGQNYGVLGFYFDIHLKEKSPWYIATGVYVKSNAGGTNIALNDPGNRPINDSVYNGFVVANGHVEKKFNTFYVPINIRYMTKYRLFVEAGAQVGLVFKSHDIYTAEVSEHTLYYDAEEKIRNNGLYKWFDGGVNGGIGYVSKSELGWKIGVWYYLGLTNFYRNDLNIPAAYNNSFYVLATIPIGKKKAERMRAEKAAGK